MKWTKYKQIFSLHNIIFNYDIFFQYSLHYKRENAHDDAMWSVAWGHRDRTEEEVVVEAPPEKDSNGENKENQDGETPAISETPG